MRYLRAAIVAASLIAVRTASAATEVQLWHAMTGELGRQLEALVTQFNGSQSDYRLVATYKGSYNDTMNAAIFGFRTRTHPPLVQVNEIATAT
ncbi:MAG: sn-glycerol-3-phosphate ABC transporter substrate-binding protein, partial [Pseudorhodoplanes sp.]